MCKTLFAPARSRFAESLACGAALEDDLRLAAQVACGKLRADAVVHGLVQSFAAMATKVQDGRVRTKSGKYMSAELMSDVVSILGNSREARNLMSLFGVAKSCTPKMPLQHDSLPDFFMAVRSESVLQRNVQLALSLLNSTGKRRHHLCFDETCITPNYDQCNGLRQEGSGIVGGCYKIGAKYDPAGDCTFHIAREHDILKLPQEDRAKLFMSFLLTSTYQNSKCFDVCQVPSQPGAQNASSLLCLTGAVLAAATQANAGLPPASMAYDGATYHCLVNAALLGLLPQEAMMQAPFWRSCSVHSVGSLPCFPYRLLTLRRILSRFPCRVQSVSA